MVPVPFVPSIGIKQKVAVGVAHACISPVGGIIHLTIIQGNRFSAVKIYPGISAEIPDIGSFDVL